MPTSTHLLTLWNPSYESSAMDQHLNVLLRWGARVRKGEAAPDDTYVWWAKVRSPRRHTPIEHMPAILELQKQIDTGAETHLYLTDYQSLYVGWLDKIDTTDLPADKNEKEHIPSYYFENNWPIDFWMRLRDIRCIVADDTAQTCEEMRKLKNLRYDEKPVSIFGGMVSIPLIVRRDDPYRWFEDREEMTGGRLWAEVDAEIRGETSRVAKDLRNNLFGPRLWSRMEPATRRFLAAGEAVFRAHRDDPTFDFSAPLLEYAKAVEAELNKMIFPTLREKMKDLPPPKRFVKFSDTKSHDLGEIVPNQSLGSIHHLLTNRDEFKEAVRTAFRIDYRFLIERLPGQLEDLRHLRNPAAHDDTIDRERLDDVRNRILGIGCEGLIVEIVKGKR